MVTPTPKQKKWRPGFSLRTLVLLQLLAGSGFGLWLRWEPWSLTRTSAGEQEIPWSSRFSQSGKREVRAGFSDKTVQIWDPQADKCLAVLDTRPNWMLEAFFSPDGDHLVAQDNLGTTHVWSRHRPEWWWGVAWLPEFWLTALLFAALQFRFWWRFSKSTGLRVTLVLVLTSACMVGISALLHVTHLRDVPVGDMFRVPAWDKKEIPDTDIVLPEVTQPVITLTTSHHLKFDWDGMPDFQIFPDGRVFERALESVPSTSLGGSQQGETQGLRTREWRMVCKKRIQVKELLQTIGSLNALGFFSLDQEKITRRRIMIELSGHEDTMVFNTSGETNKLSVALATRHHEIECYDLDFDLERNPRLRELKALKACLKLVKAQVASAREQCAPGPCEGH